MVKPSYRIPPPPAGLITVLAAAFLSFLLYHLVSPARGAAIPHYAGKPPPSPHYPGRCWCSTHGPRGGCIRWICRPKASNAAEFRFEMAPQGGVVEPPPEPPEPPPEPPPPEAGQPVPPERLMDWSLTGVPGGIPNRTRICQTFSPGATAAAISTALTNCGNSGGGVVMLNAGTYSAASLGGTIRLQRSNITLRGAGAHRTILQGRAIINMESGNTFPAGAQITAGGGKGSTQITVSATANLAVGTVIEVGRNNDPNLVVLGPGRESRMLRQMNVITAVNGSVLTLRNPLFFDFTAGNPTITRRFAPQRLNGVEDLKVDHAGFSSGPENFMIAQCDSCWIKGVDSAVAAGYHFTVQSTVNMEFRDNYIHEGPTGPNNSGIRFYGSFASTGWGGTNSNFRIENNVLDRNDPPIQLNQASSGGYIGYNYVNDSSLTDLLGLSLVDAHEPFDMMNLYEGNSAPVWGYSGYHGGAGGLGTVLRNHFTGYGPRSRQRSEAVQANRLGYFYSLVGNVLGSQEQNPGAYTGCSLWGARPIGVYRLGLPNMGNCSTSPGDNFNVPGGYPDRRVAETMIRWGNYDYFNKAARWEPSELPQGMAAPSRTLPRSYAYAERDKPAWWPGSIPWPPIGPDVTGGNGDQSGHVNKIPARLCWESGLSNGGAFNAATCFPRD